MAIPDPWPYVITIDEVKAALGIPPEDTSKDEQIMLAIANSQALVEAYICGNVSPTEHTWEQSPFEQCKKILLPNFPLISLDELKVNGVVQTPDQYSIDKKAGILTYPRGCGCCRVCCPCEWEPNQSSAEVTYTSGWDPVPSDIRLALLNLATGTYNLGGNYAGSISSTGALKSMTMFDAMSMSFETGGSSASAANPQGLVEQWAFILDKYSMCEVGMA